MERFAKYTLLLATLLFISLRVSAQEDSTASTGATSEPPETSESYGADEVIQRVKALKETAAAQWSEANVSKHFDKINDDLTAYKKHQEDCRFGEHRANFLCIEARNPDVQRNAQIIQGIMGGVVGLSDACGTFGKAMNIANTTMGLYQAQCGGWKWRCVAACGDARKSVDSLKSRFEEIKESFRSKALVVAGNATKAGDMKTAEYYNKAAEDFPLKINGIWREYLERETKTDDYKAIAKKIQTCKGYDTQLAASLIGSIGLIKSMMTAQKCEDDSKDTGLASATPVDCTIPANKQNNMTCICQDAPRTPGCNSGLESSVAAKGADSLRSASTSGYVPGNTGGSKVNMGTDGGSLDLSANNANGGSSAPGAPMGGGSAGIDGGRGFGGGPGTAPAQKASGLNTNILGGEGGGGGGGGSSWGGYSGEGREGLRQYLPGGAKDPNAAALAGQGAAVPKEVTAPSGKSNWEKVRDRYRDNKSTLLTY